MTQPCVRLDWERRVDIERFRALARVLLAPRECDLATESPHRSVEGDRKAEAEFREAVE